MFHQDLFLDRLRREMDDAFRDFFGHDVGSAYPLTNAWIGDEDLLVTMEVPGVEPDKIEIAVEGDQLIVSGTRESRPVENGRMVRCESASGKFMRTLRLPYRIDAERVEARSANGVLTLTLPRAAADKPRRIAIEAKN